MPEYEIIGHAHAIVGLGVLWVGNRDLDDVEAHDVLASEYKSRIKRLQHEADKLGFSIDLLDDVEGVEVYRGSR